ncbi:MAG TPA: glycerophosphodiester phosphodiesterase family protein [Acidimicrobiia bacterium]|nr:glycerophosphodiester phosphodiesterase family protein [Acidimicrobiia bacterium]
MVVGHRGETERHPENSLAAILAALEGVGAAEVDIRVSADGQLVLAHDAEVRGRQIAGSTWAELAELRRDGHPICLLDEVLALPGRLDLEVKNLPFQAEFDDSGRPALLVASRARPGDIVTSFYWPDMELVRRRAPEVATGLRVADPGLMEAALEHASEMGHVAVASEDPLVEADWCRRAIEAGLEIRYGPSTAPIGLVSCINSARRRSFPMFPENYVTT